MKSFDHWSHSSKSFKFLVSFVPIELFIITIACLVLWQVSDTFFYILIAAWLYHLVVGLWFGVPPRHTWNFIRTVLVGKNKPPRNENNFFNR